MTQVGPVLGGLNLVLELATSESRQLPPGCSAGAWPAGRRFVHIICFCRIDACVLSLGVPCSDLTDGCWMDGRLGGQVRVSPQVCRCYKAVALSSVPEQEGEDRNDGAVRVLPDA